MIQRRRLNLIFTVHWIWRLSLVKERRSNRRIWNVKGRKIPLMRRIFRISRLMLRDTIIHLISWWRRLNQIKWMEFYKRSLITRRRITVSSSTSMNRVMNLNIWNNGKSSWLLKLRSWNYALSYCRQIQKFNTHRNSPKWLKKHSNAVKNTSRSIRI
jgi:hypothetical protein